MRESNPRPSDFQSVQLVVRRGTTLSSNNSDGTRTRNPQIRSLIRYPLRHGVE